jgi:2-keto-4-pentenoate hydratase
MRGTADSAGLEGTMWGTLFGTMEINKKKGISTGRRVTEEYNLFGLRNAAEG